MYSQKFEEHLGNITIKMDQGIQGIQAIQGIQGIQGIQDIQVTPVQPIPYVVPRAPKKKPFPTNDPAIRRLFH